MASTTTPRFVALVQGSLAEVALGGTLFLWCTDRNVARGAPWGPVASTMMLAAAMVALAVAMLALARAAQWGTAVLRICVLVVSPVVGGEGTLAVGSLLRDPGGPFVLLVTAWIFSVAVVAALVRQTAGE
jgi:hypothetical protein